MKARLGFLFDREVSYMLQKISFLESQQPHEYLVQLIESIYKEKYNITPLWDYDDE